jgi:exodeoxyribonuclease-3
VAPSTVSTVNVNGVRAAATKGFVEWLAATGADVVCLQEVRARPEELPAAFRDEIERGGCTSRRRRASPRRAAAGSPC